MGERTTELISQIEKTRKELELSKREIRRTAHHKLNLKRRIGEYPLVSMFVGFGVGVMISSNQDIKNLITKSVTEIIAKQVRYSFKDS